MPDLSLAPLAEPVTKLIDVVARGIGKLYEPIGTVRQAEADAKAQLILADAESEKRELLLRAATRISHIEVARQKNIEKVVAEAQKELPASVSPAPVDQDWINHFFSGVQDVSSEDLQKLWGRILAGEVASPGRFSRRLIEFLKTIDKREAEMLSALLSVSFSDTNDWFFYFETKASREAMKEKIGNLGLVRHFIDIGILASDVVRVPLSKTTGMEVRFGGRPFVLQGPPKPEEKPGRISLLEHWITLQYFTAIGQQLSYVAAATRDIALVSKIDAEFSDEYKVSIKERAG